MLLMFCARALFTGYPRAMTYMTYALEPKGLLGVFHDLHDDLHDDLHAHRQPIVFKLRQSLPQLNTIAACRVPRAGA